MPLILHLSDLHLVEPSRSPVLGNHKTGLVRAADRQTHHQLLRRTLAGLGQRLERETRRIEALVMSGDVANQNEGGGHAAFLDLLDALGDAQPDPTSVVVVPGNHDVARGLQPGDPARYHPFADVMRGAGFVTPLLDGIDDGVSTGVGALRHVLRLGDVEIVPINTSAYAQVALDLGIDAGAWSAAIRAAQVSGGDQARFALERLQIADAARVSETHLDGVRRLLNEVRAQPRRGWSEHVDPLRIAVLHHQLLPVSAEEEVKTFESFTNLGLLRQFLRENHFSVVLHGHKHAPFSYVDYVVSYNVGDSQAPRQIRVIAGPAPSGRTLDDQDVVRLLDVNVEAGLITMESVPAVRAGQASGTGKRQRLTFSRPGAAEVSRTDGVLVVEGKTVSDVYARLPSVLALEADGQEVENLVCRVQESPSDEAIAPLYRGFGHAITEGADEEGEDEESPSAQLEQFQELVRWWQDAQIVAEGGEPSFRHGNRILRYAGHLDQLESVIGAILAKPSTTRAVVVLLHPSGDRIATSTPFPSFCIAQFLLRAGVGTEPPRLDCVAFFRKQEVRYWWLVNIAELASLQRRIVSRIVSRRMKDELRWMSRLEPGSITTIAARAHAGQSLPKVQIPKVDQYFAMERERLVDMAHAIVWPQMPNRVALSRDWLKVMWNLVPPEHRDPDGAAVGLPGLRYLTDQVSSHVTEGAEADNVSVRELADALETLWRENDRYSSLQQLGRASAAKYVEWRATVKECVEHILELAISRMNPVPVTRPTAGNAGSRQKSASSKRTAKKAKLSERAEDKSPYAHRAPAKKAAKRRPGTKKGLARKRTGGGNKSSDSSVGRRDGRRKKRKAPRRGPGSP